MAIDLAVGEPALRGDNRARRNVRRLAHGPTAPLRRRSSASQGRSKSRSGFSLGRMQDTETTGASRASIVEAATSWGISRHLHARLSSPIAAYANTQLVVVPDRFPSKTSAGIIQTTICGKTNQLNSTSPGATMRAADSPPVHCGRLSPSPASRHVAAFRDMAVARHVPGELDCAAIGAGGQRNGGLPRFRSSPDAAQRAVPAAQPRSDGLRAPPRPPAHRCMRNRLLQKVDQAGPHAATRRTSVDVAAKRSGLGRRARGGRRRAVRLAVEQSATRWRTSHRPRREKSCERRFQCFPIVIPAAKPRASSRRTPRRIGRPGADSIGTIRPGCIQRSQCRCDLRTMVLQITSRKASRATIRDDAPTQKTAGRHRDCRPRRLIARTPIVQVVAGFSGSVSWIRFALGSTLQHTARELMPARCARAEGPPSGGECRSEPTARQATAGSRCCRHHRCGNPTA